MIITCFSMVRNPQSFTRGHGGMGPGVAFDGSVAAKCNPGDHRDKDLVSGVCE